MPPVVRANVDPCSGHGPYGPRPASEGSPDTKVDGHPVHCQGHAWPPHGHPGNAVLSGGSATVKVNGKPVGRVGDAVSCGSTAAHGSPTTNIG